MVGKVMWMGRATVFLVGLAVILAAVMGVASMALAANGKPFILGKSNVATKISKLVKSGAGPALDLRVDSGPPLAVDSDEQVANLNADKVDGMDSGDFFSGETCFVAGSPTDNSAGGNTSTLALCDVGDIVTGGGYSGIDPSFGTMIESKPERFNNAGGQQEGWLLFWKNAAPSLDADVRAHANCLDFPPLR